MFSSPPKGTMLNHGLKRSIDHSVLASADISAITLQQKTSPHQPQLLFSPVAIGDWRSLILILWFALPA